MPCDVEMVECGANLEEAAGSSGSSATSRPEPLTRHASGRNASVACEEESLESGEEKAGVEQEVATGGQEQMCCGGSVPAPNESEERMAGRSAALEGDQTAGSVLIAPWGEVRSANGSFLVDREAVHAVLEAFAAQGTELPIDYEHQSLGGVYASPSGQAPAAGWIRSLRAVSPDEAGDGVAGLFADVVWTEAARARLVAREYRYLSPVVVVRRSDRRMVSLHSAALTNKPAIVGMRPIVNRQSEPLTGHATGVALRGNASVACQGEPAEIERLEIAALDSGIHCAGGPLETLCMRLGLEPGSNVESVLAAAEKRLAAAEDRLVRLEREALAREAEDRVAAAAAAGKLPGSLREWAMSLAMKDPAAFDAWASAAPAAVSPGRTEAPTLETDPGGRNRTAVIAAARASYQSEPALALITSEEDWVEEALREGEVGK